MHSIRNEGKCVAAERFIRTLKPKICQYMTSLSKNAYINKLIDRSDFNGIRTHNHFAPKRTLSHNIYNNKYHNTIIMKPASVRKMIKILNLKLAIM